VSQELTFNDVSGDGSVILGVHTTNDNGDEVRRAYVWRWGMQGFTQVPEGQGSYPVGINFDATIVGGAAETCAGSDCTYPAARWTKAGVSLVPGNPGALYGISEAGAVVGFQRDTDSVLQSYVFNGTTTTFAATLALSSISGDGTHCGGAADGGPVVLWYSNGTQSIPSTSPFRADGVNAINRDGSVVVGYGWDSSEQTDPMFLWRVGHGVDVIQPLAGFPQVIPWDISADGSVVVGVNRQFAVQPPTPVTDIEAFYWDTPGGLRSVADELTTRGVTLPADLQLHGVKLSADGSVLMGDGFQDGKAILWRAQLFP